MLEGPAVPPINGRCTEQNLVEFLIETEWMDPLPAHLLGPSFDAATTTNLSDVTTHQQHRLLSTGSGCPTQHQLPLEAAAVPQVRTAAAAATATAAAAAPPHSSTTQLHHTTLHGFATLQQLPQQQQQPQQFQQHAAEHGVYTVGTQQMPEIRPAAKGTARQPSAPKQNGGGRDKAAAPDTVPPEGQTGKAAPAARTVSKRRASATGAFQPAAPTAEMRTLEQQIAAYQEQLSELMRTNLQLKEREVLMEEMCAFRKTQATIRYGDAWQDDSNASADPSSCDEPPPRAAASTSSSFEYGLMGNCTGNHFRAGIADDSSSSGCSSRRDVVVPSGYQTVLGSRESAVAAAMLPLKELEVAYARMVSQLSLLIVQTEVDPSVQVHLDTAIGNSHWFFETLTMKSEHGCSLFGRRLDEPDDHSGMPEAKARCLVASLRLTRKQVDRIADLLAIIQPQMDALDEEHQRLRLQLAGSAVSAASSSPDLTPADAVTPATGDTVTGVTSAPPLLTSCAASTSGDALVGSLPGGTPGGTAGTTVSQDDVAARILSLGLYHGVEGEEVVDKLHRAGVCTRDFMGLLAAFTCKRILSEEQTARVVIHSYPWMPDMMVIINFAASLKGTF